MSDESFFDLLKILEEGKKKDDKPTPEKKVFSLNVDESGKVNQVTYLIQSHDFNYLRMGM